MIRSARRGASPTVRTQQPGLAPVPTLPPLAVARGLREAFGAVAGLLAAGLTLGVGHLVASLIAPAASPVFAVGATFIDLTPEWLKSFAIATFGENDKIALLAGIASVLAVAAVAIGLVAIRRLPIAVVAIASLGAAGAAASLAARRRPPSTSRRRSSGPLRVSRPSGGVRHLGAPASRAHGR